MIKMQPNHAQYICPTQIQERPVWIKSIQCYKDTVWDNEGLKQNSNWGIKNAKMLALNLKIKRTQCTQPLYKQNQYIVVADL